MKAAACCLLSCCQPAEIFLFAEPWWVLAALDAICREWQRDLQCKCKLLHKCSLNHLRHLWTLNSKKNPVLVFHKISSKLAGRIGFYLQNKSDEQATGSSWKFLTATVGKWFISNSFDCSTHWVTYRGPYTIFFVVVFEQNRMKHCFWKSHRCV